MLVVLALYVVHVKTSDSVDEERLRILTVAEKATCGKVGTSIFSEVENEHIIIIHLQKRHSGIIRMRNVTEKNLLEVNCQQIGGAYMQTTSANITM